VRRRSQKTILTLLRQRLETWPAEVPLGEWLDEDAAARLNKTSELERFVRRVRQFGELFVGMANGPFLLVMRADNPEAFLRYSDRHPTHDVQIYLQERVAGQIQTIVQPTDQPAAYELSFGLPRLLEDHVLFDERRGVRLASGVKRRFFSEITVYRRVGGRDVLYRLTYNPETSRRLRA
jgi:hypothetical protein